MNAPLLFSTNSYAAMKAGMLQLGGWEAGEVEQQDFPDGERYQRLLTHVEDRDVVLLGGTVSDADTLTIYDLACGLVKYGARRLTLVIPYFGYSTMERAVKHGEIVTAKTRARLLSSIPVAGLGNRVWLLDLHSEGLPHYFEGGVVPYHLYAKPVIVPAIRQLGGDDFVLACTDAGRAKWVQSLANELHVDASFVFKRRLDGQNTRITAVSAQVEGRRVVIYDDMIRTGGSLMQAACAYRDAGASSISAITTHGIFPGDSLTRLSSSGLFTSLTCTDSHPRALSFDDPFLQVLPLAPLFHSTLLP